MQTHARALVARAPRETRVRQAAGITSRIALSYFQSSIFETRNLTNEANQRGGARPTENGILIRKYPARMCQISVESTVRVNSENGYGVNQAMNELSREERETDVAERKWSRAESRCLPPS